MNYGGDCRTAPATPGLLNIFTARHALMVEDGAFSHKIDNSQFLGDPKLHHWFRSYGDFTEYMDFAYWWSFSGGASTVQGLRLSGLPRLVYLVVSKD